MYIIVLSEDSNAGKQVALYSYSHILEAIRVRFAKSFILVEWCRSKGKDYSQSSILDQIPTVQMPIAFYLMSQDRLFFKFICCNPNSFHPLSTVVITFAIKK